jgi:hypothetical protein
MMCKPHLSACRLPHIRKLFVLAQRGRFQLILMASDIAVLAITRKATVARRGVLDWMRGYKDVIASRTAVQPVASNLTAIPTPAHIQMITFVESVVVPGETSTYLKCLSTVLIVLLEYMSIVTSSDNTTQKSRYTYCCHDHTAVSGNCIAIHLIEPRT